MDKQTELLKRTAPAKWILIVLSAFCSGTAALYMQFFPGSEIWWVLVPLLLAFILWVTAPMAPADGIASLGFLLARAVLGIFIGMTTVWAILVLDWESLI